MVRLQLQLMQTSTGIAAGDRHAGQLWIEGKTMTPTEAVTDALRINP
jgi:hypothetical protein